MREKRKKGAGYHKAMHMYMEGYKKSKGKSAGASCEEIGPKYNVSISMSTVQKKV